MTVSHARCSRVPKLALPATARCPRNDPLHVLDCAPDIVLGHGPQVGLTRRRTTVLQLADGGLRPFEGVAIGPKPLESSVRLR
jgi:hypothetical protein